MSICYYGKADQSFEIILLAKENDVKTYMLCKHATGYLHKFIVNAGKNT